MLRTSVWSRWTPSPTSSTTHRPLAAAARSSGTGPGARWCTGRMPLNRWVAVGRVERTGVPAPARAAMRKAASARPARTGAAPESVCPKEGRAPPSTSAAMTPPSPVAPGRSGARVMVTTCPRPRPISSRVSSASGAVMKAGSWAPQRSREMKGPSRWMPASSPASHRSASTRVRRRRISGAAVTQEAIRLVVPARRCSMTATIARPGPSMSGKDSPPPPWQWTSTSPGSR